MNWIELLGWNETQLKDLRTIGYFYIQEGHYDIALTFFLPLSFLEKNFYDLQTVGALYLQKGKYLDALQYLDRALKINPAHPQALFNRTKALLGLGYKKQAYEILQSLKISKDKPISEKAEALLLSNF